MELYAPSIDKHTNGAYLMTLFVNGKKVIATIDCGLGIKLITASEREREGGERERERKRAGISWSRCSRNTVLDRAVERRYNGGQAKGKETQRWSCTFTSPRGRTCRLSECEASRGRRRRGVKVSLLEVSA